MAPLLYTLGLDAGGFLKAAGSAISVMGSMELAIQGIGRAAAVMSAAFNLAADVERTTVAIDTITKSAATTAQVMGDLKKLAADTPFEMSDLAPAARMLLGAGTAAKEVSKQLRVLGDVAAGADTDLLGLVTVFNQVRGKGKLLSDDFNQLAERGVAGLREEIAKLKGISISGVADALSSGAVSARDLEAVLVRMTSSGGISFGAMEKQAQTFAGKLSTLSDAWASLLVSFAAPINDSLKPVIDDITGLTEALAPAFGVIGAEVAGVVTAVHEFINGLENGATATAAMALAFGGLIEKAYGLARVPLDAIAAALPGLGAAMTSLFSPLVEWLGTSLDAVAQRFSAGLAGALADVVKQLPGLADVGARMEFNAAGDRARGELQQIGANRQLAADSGPAFAQASANLSLAAEAMRDTFGAGLNDFIAGIADKAAVSGGNDSTAAAVVGESVARAIIAKIETPQGSMYTTLPGSGESNGSNAAQLEVLRGLLSEMQRINTY